MHLVETTHIDQSEHPALLLKTSGYSPRFLSLRTSGKLHCKSGLAASTVADDGYSHAAYRQQKWPEARQHLRSCCLRVQCASTAILLPFEEHLPTSLYPHPRGPALCSIFAGCRRRNTAEKHETCSVLKDCSRHQRNHRRIKASPQAVLYQATTQMRLMKFIV
jgi:hypothetical protein